MSKNAISIIVFIILLIIFTSAFSKSYTSHNMSNLAYVLALGFDVGETGEMKISAQFIKHDSFSPNSSSSDESNSIILVSGEADCIYSGLNLINSYIGKEINLAHCSAVIFSEEFAKNGISSQIYSLINNEELRPTTNLVISKCDAYDYLYNVKPNLEKITSNYYDTFSLTSEFTGYFSDITVGDFLNTLSIDYCDATAILGGLDKTARSKEEESDSSSKSNNSSSSSSDSSSSKSSESDSSEESPEKQSSSSESSNKSTEANKSNKNLNIITNPENLVAGSSSIEGKRGSENIGLAVFDNDKLCGELTAMETICHLLIKNDVSSFITPIDNPLSENKEKKVGLNLTPVKNSKVSVTIEDGIPHISVKIAIQASILTLETDTDYEREDILEKFSIAEEEYLENQFHNYFDKISKEYGTDIDCFSNKALVNFPTTREWKNFNWKEKFKSAKFDIDVDVNVMSSLLITKT